MIFKKLKIPELILFEPNVFEDQRGFFFESFNKELYEKAIELDLNFVQDNHSASVKNVLRGLHYQLRSPQGKLVRVTQGEVYDVAVDIRKTSPTFGKWAGVYLSAENKKQLWIPEGFAHGFLTISDFAQFQYKTTCYYNPNDEFSIIWNDDFLNIDWPLTSDPIVSEKDKKAQSFIGAKVFK